MLLLQQFSIEQRFIIESSLPENQAFNRLSKTLFQKLVSFGAKSLANNFFGVILERIFHFNIIPPPTKSDLITSAISKLGEERITLEDN
jgi:hypothetical protein